jgi:hypothetical protein
VKAFYRAANPLGMKNERGMIINREKSTAPLAGELSHNAKLSWGVGYVVASLINWRKCNVCRDWE